VKVGRLILPVLLGAACVVCGEIPIGRLAGALARAEGWGQADSLVRRLHNPGGLVYAGQRDASKGPGGYARFKTDLDGWHALERDLERKIARGLDIRGIVKARTPSPAEQLRTIEILRRLGLLPEY
jgi:hypothetical protein